jgi:hypothetical protein
MAVRLSAPRAGRPLPPERFLVLILVTLKTNETTFLESTVESTRHSIQFKLTKHMTLDVASRRSKVDSTHDFPATLERHGRSFRHISPWLTAEEFTREGARLFRRRVTGQAGRPPSRQESFRVDTCARRRGDSRLDESRFVCFQP